LDDYDSESVEEEEVKKEKRKAGYHHKARINRLHGNLRLKALKPSMHGVRCLSDV
jgi:hypothetical protein